jgi:Prolyl-tRNA synthetase
VGHVFKLGAKYSRAMKAAYLDSDGKEKYMVMGCYGIGIGRTVAASIEQNYDANGIIWPLSIAPFQVIITPVSMNNEVLLEAAEKLYQDFSDEGIEVILDDRDERAGVKFNDADLIGIPLRVTIGPKRLAEGKVEVKIRKTGDVRILSMDEVRKFVIKEVRP